jgi:hypothetical protein
MRTRFLQGLGSGVQGLRKQPDTGWIEIHMTRGRGDVVTRGKTFTQTKAFLYFLHKLGLPCETLWWIKHRFHENLRLNQDSSLPLRPLRPPR